MEREVLDTYFSARFVKVQYGTFRGDRVCLMVIAFQFHASDLYNRRFRKAMICVCFASSNANKNPSKCLRVLDFAPRLAFGTLSHYKSNATANASLPISLAAVSAAPVTITTSMSRSTERTKGNRLVIEGSERGSPPNRVVWSINENPDHPDGMRGVPSRVQTAIMLRLNPGNEPVEFSASFEVTASIGWTLDPRRWPAFKPYQDDPVSFDSSTPLLMDHEVVGPTLDEVDLSKLWEFTEPSAPLI